MRAPVLPLRDSIRPRRRPWVTIALIVVNTAIFVVSLGHGRRRCPTTTRPHGSDQRLRPHHAGVRLHALRGRVASATARTTARLCATGADDDDDIGQRPRRPGGRVADAASRDVHARRLDAPDRQHAVPVGLRQQRRGRHGPRRASCCSTSLCGLAAVADAVAIDTSSEVPNIGASGRDLRRARRLPRALPARPRADGHPAARVPYVAEMPARLVLLTCSACRCWTARRASSTRTSRSGSRTSRTSAASWPGSCWRGCCARLANGAGAASGPAAAVRT